MSARRPVVPVPLAFAALVGGCGLAAWTLGSALKIEPLMDLPPARSEALPVPAPNTGTPPAQVAAAVSHDPFHPERRRPAVRFRLPGESLAADGAVPASAADNSFLLIGTAVMSDGGGFAMCQWGTEPPKLVRVGERVGTLTLKVVARGRATFADAGGRLMEIRVPKAGT
jgi:hypothetical protein